jgi:hypothetical protein
MREEEPQMNADEEVSRDMGVPPMLGVWKIAGEFGCRMLR